MRSSIRGGRPSRARLLRVAALIVLSTALFVLGVALERGAAAPETPGTHQEVSQNAGVAAAGTTAPATPADTEGSASAEASHTEAASGSGETPQERVLGIDLENPWIVGAIGAGWLVLLASLFLVGRPALVVVVVAAGAATLFDGVEVGRQIGHANALVASIAILVAVSHAALALLAWWVLTRDHPLVASQMV